MCNKAEIDKYLLLIYILVTSKLDGKSPLNCIKLIASYFDITFRDNIFTKNLITKLLIGEDGCYINKGSLQKRLSILFRVIEKLSERFCDDCYDCQIVDKCLIVKQIQFKRECELLFIDRMRDFLYDRKKARFRRYLIHREQECLLCWRTVFKNEVDDRAYAVKIGGQKRRYVDLCYEHRSLKCNHKDYKRLNRIKNNKFYFFREKIKKSIAMYSKSINLADILFKKLFIADDCFPELYKYLQSTGRIFESAKDVVEVLESPTDYDALTNSEKLSLQSFIEDHGFAFEYYKDTLISAEAWLQAIAASKHGGSRVKSKKNTHVRSQNNTIVATKKTISTHHEYRTFCHFCWRSSLVFSMNDIFLCYDHSNEFHVEQHKRKFLAYRRYLKSAIIVIKKNITTKHNLNKNNLILSDFIYTELLETNSCLPELYQYLHASHRDTLSREDIIKILESPVNMANLDHENVITLKNNIDYFVNNFHEYIEPLIHAEAWMTIERMIQTYKSKIFTYPENCLSQNKYKIDKILESIEPLFFKYKTWGSRCY